MKIAIVFGKGLDGCGVQRGAIEIATWAKRNGVQFDVYEYTGRTFCRAAGQKFPDKHNKFDVTQLDEVAVKLNGDYDIVILNSYPSNRQGSQNVIDFYNKVMTKLEKPIVVGMMHEILRMNIDRIPMLMPILNRCDVVYNFSEKTNFSQELSNILPSKVLGERMKRFKMWVDLKQLKENYHDVYSLESKRKSLVYVGRWTTMKDPRRLLDMYPIMREKDPDFHLLMHGIEKSVGAAKDIIRQPNSFYKLYFKEYDWTVPGVQVFGQYKYHDGMKAISESLFACSFFRLPKAPNNYGDRMEYTQIEIIGCGSIPVFDKHFGENNYDSNGNRFCDNDHLAVWSDRNDLEETCDKLISVANDPTEQRKYRDSGYAFIDREFNADSVLPKMFDDILKIGKDTGRLDDKELVNGFFGTDKAYEDFCSLMSDVKPPAMGLKEYDEKTLRYFATLKGKREDAFCYAEKPSRRRTKDDVEAEVSEEENDD
jgi:glycosyltransferase involved in cell wall biosynthesis